MRKNDQRDIEAGRSVEELQQIMKERNEALFSLDETKIKAFLIKYGVEIANNPMTFWAGVYKSISVIQEAPPELVDAAHKWLRDHGYRPFPLDLI